MRRGRRLVAPAAAAIALLACAAAAAAPPHGPPLAPYDGSNPFNCALQQLGRGTSFPDPNADPLCVEYDKTNQDLAGLGVVSFLSNEPARTAVAAGKCFYFQHDHWTGSVLQGGGIETYHWDGSYYFDRARGAGAVYFVNVRAAGSGGDPAYVTFIPEPFRDYFNPSGGGGAADFQIDPDPSCAARVDTPAKAAKVYRSSSAAAPRRAPVEACSPASGSIGGRRVGPIALGMTHEGVRRALGAAEAGRGSVERHCLEGGGAVLVGFARGRAALIVTTSGRYRIDGVRAGSRARAAHRRIRSLRRLFAAGPVQVEASPADRGTQLLVGIERGGVRYLGILDSRLVRRAGRAARYLRRPP